MDYLPLLIYVKKKIFEYLATTGSNDVIYPEDWIDNDQDISIHEVSKSDPLFSQLVQKCNATMKMNVLKIERIQNKLEYNEYYHQKKEIEKLVGNANEKRLFHGTRSTDPQIIIQNGFDMRYSNSGMWGRGIYFAVNSSYSGTNYFSTTKDGKKQLFIASVLVGAPLECPSNNAIIHPPVNPKLLEKKIIGKMSYYNSITGVTGGSQVFIVYSNYLAYPSYLVTYE